MALTGRISVLEDRTLLAAPVLVKDISPNALTERSSNPEQFTPIGDKLFFVADSIFYNVFFSDAGKSVYVTDGTAEGTTLLREFRDGEISSLVESNGELYFVVNENEIWKTDGTAAGTTCVAAALFWDAGQLTDVEGGLFFSAQSTLGSELWKLTNDGAAMVSDMAPGNLSSSPGQLTVVGSDLFFTTYDTATGNRLWKSDGTAAGTVLISEIDSGPGVTHISQIVELDGIAYFTCLLNGVSRRLWRSDGTAAGTFQVSDVVPFYDGANPGADPLTLVGGRLFIEADNGDGSRDLWTSDGTATGTTRLTYHATVGAQPNRSFATGPNGDVYFAHRGGSEGAELWKTDGTVSGTVLVKDIHPTLGGTPAFLTNLEGTLFFVAYDDVSGVEIWKSDGTSAGTVRISDFQGRPNNSPSPRELTAFQGRIFFSVDAAVSGRELWSTDGTSEGTTLFKDFIPERGFDSVPTAFVKVNGVTYFIAHSREGYQLRRTDGTADGTLMIEAIGIPDESGKTYPFAYQDKVYFSANDSVHGYELWVSDGTSDGTYMVLDLQPGAGSGFYGAIAKLDESLYLAGRGGIYRSDGTADGTVLISDVIVASDFTEMDGILYFAGIGQGSLGIELYRTDGTAAGTWMVKDIFGGSGDSEPWNFIATDGRLYFWAKDSAHGFELWTSDGTPSGTALVKDSVPGPSSSSQSRLTAFEGEVYYAHQDESLWKSDGSAAGTLAVTSSFSHSLTIFEDSLYFVGRDPAHGYELWKSDGTPAGTSRVTDLSPGFASSVSWEGIRVVGDRMYLAAEGSEFGLELWVSDGTTEGTRLLADVNPSGGSFPQALFLDGTKLYFSAITTELGRELWMLDLNQPPTALSLNSSRIDENMSAMTVVGQFTTSDPEGGTDFVYALVSGEGDEGNSAFTIVGSQILALSPFDHESQRAYSVRVRSTDSGGLSIDHVFVIDVSDLDEFDVTSPVDTSSPLNSISESAFSGAVGIIAFAFDADGTHNTVTYSLTDSAGGRFTIDTISGVVTVADASLLDYESAASHTITVQAASSDGSMSTQSFVINVLDVDEFDVGPLTDTDSPPKALPENSSAIPIGITAFASDADGTTNAVTYTLIDSAGGRFVIDAETGAVRLADDASIDFETASSHSIVVRATSEDGSSSEQAFTIEVTDVDEFNVNTIVDLDPSISTIPEHSPAGTAVGITVFAQDLDGSQSGITYSLWNTRGGRFAIDPVTGVVTVADGEFLDREAQAAWTITVLATSQDGSVSVQDFTIELEDVNEFAVGRLFDLDPAPNLVPEHAPAGTLVGITGFAIDLDATGSGVNYSLWDTRGGRFAIDPVTGVVTIANGEYLDREVRPSWSITVLATSQDGSVSVKEFTVHLADVNEFRVGQVFDLDPAVNTVLENSPTGTPVGITGFAIDLDATRSGVTYSLWNTRGGRFAVDPVTGVVTIADGALIDREVQGTWTITLLATSADGSISVKEFTIDVEDVDEHDVGRVFDLDPAANRVAENAAPGTAVGITGFGIDLDATDSGVTYSLTDTAGGRFVIDGSTGVVTVAQGALFNREAENAPAAYDVTIKATSQDGSASLKVFTIQVADADEFDVGPVSDGNAAVNTVVENAAAGTLVGITARATDGDATNNRVTYSLADNAGGRFEIHPTTGVVSVATGAVLDFETQASHAITVRATSSDGSTSSQSFTIEVTNVLDARRITLSNDKVAENRPGGTVVGTLGLADVEVTSPVYRLVGGAGSTDNSKFTISGNQLKTRSSFDFEAKSSYSIRVQMRPASGVVLTQVFTIRVTDEPG